MRDITEVIDKIIKQVPPTKYAALIERLKWVKNDACYKPPEARQPCWGLLMNELNEHLSWPPETLWQKKIALIMQGKTEKQIEEERIGNKNW